MAKGEDNESKADIRDQLISLAAVLWEQLPRGEQLRLLNEFEVSGIPHGHKFYRQTVEIIIENHPPACHG